MQANINCLHPISAYVDADNKNHYLQMHIQITVLRYMDTVINHICISFIYNIYFEFFIYKKMFLINSPKRCCFGI
jgi:hypothetical protein